MMPLVTASEAGEAQYGRDGFYGRPVHHQETTLVP